MLRDRGRQLSSKSPLKGEERASSVHPWDVYERLLVSQRISQPPPFCHKWVMFLSRKNPLPTVPWAEKLMQI